MHGKRIVSFANTSKGGEKPLVGTAPCQHSKLSETPHLRSGWFKRQRGAFVPSVLSITRVAPRGGVQLDLGISACISGWHFPAFYRVPSDQLSTHRGHDSHCNPCVQVYSNIAAVACSDALIGRLFRDADWLAFRALWLVLPYQQISRKPSVRFTLISDVLAAANRRVPPVCCHLC